MGGRIQRECEMKNKPRIYYLEWEAELYLSHSIWMAPLVDLLYRRLIDAWWIHKGLPSDEKKLAGFARYTQADFDECWPEIRDFFYVKGKNGEQLGHKFLEEKLDKCLANSKAKSESGKIGAQKRWQRHSNAIANPIAKNGYIDTDTDIKEKVEKEKNNRASPSTIDFTKVDGLYINAWDEWLAYRSKMKYKKYKTTALARKLAKLPPDAQLACIEHSIGNQYQGLFPDRYTNLKKQVSGNGYDQPPPRAQPPDGNKYAGFSKPFTPEERDKAKQKLKEARGKMSSIGSLVKQAKSRIET